MFDDPQELAKFFASANAVVRPLLQSPLHRIISGRLMLLGYTGGKTGNRYSFAVGYFPWHDGEVLVSSSANWAKTIGSARDVQLLIKGRSSAAKPNVITDAEQKADILDEFERRNGAKAAKGLMLGCPATAHRPEQNWSRRRSRRRSSASRSSARTTDTNQGP